MTLFAQLEDSKWACCGQCLKLHTRAEFDLVNLSRRPSSRRCADWAGIVGLCPCITLTIQDRAHVVRFLTGMETDDPVVRRFFDTGLLKESVNE